ncbi:hypothetical protein J8V44_17825 [Photorhabdus bodei]|nr:hypothetical protein [Photorhabdus bodei]
MKTDGKLRCMSVGYEAAGITGYYLLEVDTSDATKVILTKVIIVKTVGDIEVGLYL